jgi:hypothetical protein
MFVENLDLLNFSDQLQIKKEGFRTYIYDLVRKKYIILQPEELVRQLLVLLLHSNYDYPLQKFSVESGIKVNTLQKRYDILIFDRALQSVMMIECKAAHVKIDKSVFEQAAFYNMTLKVPYILMSNGLNTVCCKINYDEKRLEYLPEIPKYHQIAG